jgi:RNA-directed DNA polymerase
MMGTQMTAQAMPGAGAPRAPELTWDTIDWPHANSNVRRLQVRIAKAYREGKHGKVKSLQWILTHSFCAKLLAVKRVTENKGAKTPGVDHITWRTPKQKMAAALSLKRRSYKAQPLRRIYIPKKQKGKLRPLSIPVMQCRGQQALHLLALEPITETVADKNSYGFRPFRSTADAHARCHMTLSKGNSAQFIFEGDIKACFDTISHQWLIDHTPMDKTMLKKWLSAGYLENGELFKTDFGTPQGGIISPALLIATLNGLENAVKSAVSKRGDKVNVCSYADDFIITGATKEVLVNKVIPVVETFLKERGLELSKEKTKITHINEGFDFLGVNMRKYNGKLIIKPAKDNVKRFLDNIRETVKSNRATKTENLIRLLNPKIIGWANFHRHICAKRTFESVSHYLFGTLWRWAKRRHPNKGKKWIRHKYFRTKSKQHWIFSTKIKDSKGKASYLDLVEIGRTPIRRHIKIRAEATPYDPAHQEYFVKRKKLREDKKLFRPCKTSWSAWWELES